MKVVKVLLGATMLLFATELEDSRTLNQAIDTSVASCDATTGAGIFA